MSDVEEQNDEICVLESIYTLEELKIERDVEGRISGQFFAFVTLPPKFNITYKMIELGKPSADIPTDVIHVSYLPPIILSFNLPADYPSQSMPDYHISCSWLPFSKLKALSKKLESLWTENNKMVILYIWTQFLKEDSLLFLEVGDSLDVTGFYVNKLKKIQSVPVNKIDSRKENLPIKKLKNPDTELNEERIKRISISPIPNMYLHQFLKAYSDDRAKTEFQRGAYMCDICFTEKVGAKCIKFVPCEHVYCKECMKSFFEVRIKDGSIHSMPCPYDRCTSEALQSQIHECVGPHLYARYDRQLLSATLDKMQDITYCPRTVCGCPVMRENDEKMAVCPSCNHVFCVFCKMTYHGVEPCRLKTEEKLKLIKEYEEGDESIKQKLEKRYGKKQIALIMADAKSESWISTNSKSCPNCNVAIEKSDGCNKMSCWKCNAFFCWLCLATLDPAYPYYHYIDPTSRCHSQLFEGTFDGVNLLDEEDDDLLGCNKIVGGYKSESGSCYWGAWNSAGERNGTGTLRLPDKSLLKGDFRGNMATGLGVILFPDGAKYEGELLNGWFHGYGVFWRSDGMKFEGEFKGGRVWGLGLVTFPDGSHGFPRHEGFFQDCRMINSQKCPEIVQKAQKAAFMARINDIDEE